MSKILVTGTAGFIGFHVSLSMLKKGNHILGIDNLNSYYDVKLKKARLKILQQFERFKFLRADLIHYDQVLPSFRTFSPEIVIHLAAQAGVRYSISNPHAYVQSNLVAFTNILELCRHQGAKHLVYASSSSVYGANKVLPFSVHHNVDHPVSLYAATKKANELMAHTYSHLFELPTTGLRFFTVYGPWGRPDMAMFIFTKAILEGKPIQVFNYGKMKRDFTYIDDVVEGVCKIAFKPPQGDLTWDGINVSPAKSSAPYRLYNIGNNKPVELLYLISVIEQKLDRKAKTELLPIQQGDVEETFADIRELANDIGFQPSTPIEVGVGRFVDWYRSFYKV